MIKKSTSPNERRFFSIVLREPHSEHWTDWFETSTQPETAGQLQVISGEVHDLAEFIGILSRLQFLNLDPIEVRYHTGNEETRPATPAV